jgi:mRNA deadenylase 3'-5' endonuclease subunit Ccr4
MLIGNRPSFTVASYNVLANAYIKPNYYPACDPKDLEWRVREPRLITRIEGLDADVICLQEVELGFFHSLDACLRTRGYTGRWAHKGQGKPDGCATFVRTALGSVRWEIWELEGPDDKPSGHVVLAAHLDRGSGPFVANTHLKWDPAAVTVGGQVGYAQARDLVIVMRSWPKTIVCGDFNATPDHETLKLFTSMGYLDPHPPTCTTFNSDARPRKLDYILHRTDLQARPLPSNILTSTTIVPSASEPSDHAPLIAEFTAAGK